MDRFTLSYRVSPETATRIRLTDLTRAAADEIEAKQRSFGAFDFIRERDQMAALRHLWPLTPER